MTSVVSCRNTRALLRILPIIPAIHAEGTRREAEAHAPQLPGSNSVLERAIMARMENALCCRHMRTELSTVAPMAAAVDTVSEMRGQVGKVGSSPICTLPTTAVHKHSNQPTASLQVGSNNSANAL